MSTSTGAPRKGVTMRSRAGAPVAGRAPGPRRRRARSAAWQRWIPYLFLLPALVLELVVHFGPMLAGVAMSLHKLTQYQLAQWWKAPWSWLDNYRVV
jgi:multiple sugar transport system permease protein